MIIVTGIPSGGSGNSAPGIPGLHSYCVRVFTHGEDVPCLYQKYAGDSEALCPRRRCRCLVCELAWACAQHRSQGWVHGRVKVCVPCGAKGPIGGVACRVWAAIGAGM